MNFGGDDVVCLFFFFIISHTGVRDFSVSFDKNAMVTMSSNDVPATEVLSDGSLSHFEIFNMTDEPGSQ